jgi:hypothetical protein
LPLKLLRFFCIYLTPALMLCFIPGTFLHRRLTVYLSVSTKIVGSDGAIGGDEVAAMQSDPAFSAAVPILVWARGVFGRRFFLKTKRPMICQDRLGTNKPGI